MSESVRSKRRIAVVTGTRAEFGLLRSVMRAVAANPQLELNVLATGVHLLPPQNTIEEVRAEFEVAATIPMQSPNQLGRCADAEALGRGITGFAEVFAQEQPDIVTVLGDRIEAFAAAAAAAVCGIRVAHMHGGDRAQGVADESMRHAITKLSHIHLPATQQSALRVIAMGEDPQRVHVIGSPAIDDLESIKPLDDAAFRALGSPAIVVLLHPCGDQDELEQQRAVRLFSLARAAGPTLILHPNHDPGCDGILKAIKELPRECTCVHLSREKFVGLLRRVKVIMGNSSAGLIECAAVPVRCINIGPRQAGREMPANVVDVPDWNYQTVDEALRFAVKQPRLSIPEVKHPFGDGRAGERAAQLLATIDLQLYPVAKRNFY